MHYLLFDTYRTRLSSVSMRATTRERIDFVITRRSVSTRRRVAFVYIRGTVGSCVTGRTRTRVRVKSVHTRTPVHAHTRTALVYVELTTQARKSWLKKKDKGHE